MDKGDIKSLFAFFSAVRPKWAPEKNAELAWLIMLEPYEYDDVMRGATACLRKNSYIPDPAEILAEIGGPAADAAPAAERRFDAKELAALDDYHALQERRCAAGLPPVLSMAHTFGLSAMELAERYDAARLAVTV